MLFSAVLLRTLAGRRTPREAFEPWVAAGTVWFVVAAGLGAVASLEDDIVWHHLLWPAFVLGGAGSWILGVGRRLFPLSLGWPARRGLDRPGFLVYQTAVIGHVVGSWPSLSLNVLRVAAAIGLVVAVVLVARGVGLFSHRWSEHLAGDEGYRRHVHAAWAWLFVGLGANAAATLAAGHAHTFVSLTSTDFTRHTLTVGFVTQMIVGIGCRFIPVFAGVWLWSPRVHGVAFWLLNAAVVLRAPEGMIGLGYWAGAWPFLALAGPPAVAAVGLFAINIAMTLRLRARPRYRRSSVAHRRLSDLLRVPERRAIIEAAGVPRIMNASVIGLSLARLLTLEQACRLAGIAVDPVVGRLDQAESSRERP
jgi:hypothetical protein